MPIRSSTTPILKDGRGSASVGRLIEGLRTQRSPSGPMVAEAFTVFANSQNAIARALRDPVPIPESLVIVDSSGKPIAWIGDEPPYHGLWAEQVYIGPGGPATSPFFCDGFNVVIGKNGRVIVQDPFGSNAAWVGTQYDTLPVTGAANNGANLVRLTVVGHTYSTGDSAIVESVGGCERYANGTWTVTKIDADHIDLQSSLFGGTYTSGGTVTRLLHVSGAVDNGSGLIRLTVTAHGYESGDRVSVASVGGVTNATGQWTITVVTANTFDLVGSTFAGTYTSGGTCIRYFGGMLAQTFAIGTDFANYKLRAFADGSLRIKDALITLSALTGDITLDPATGKIVAAAAPGGSGFQVRMEAGVLNVEMKNNTDPGAAAPYLPRLEFSPHGWTQRDLAGIPVVYIDDTGVVSAQSYKIGATQVIDSSRNGSFLGITATGSIADLQYATNAHVALRRANGSAGSETAVQAGDALGFVSFSGHNGTSFAGRRATVIGSATENWTALANGAVLIFEVTPNGSAAPAEKARLTPTGLGVLNNNPQYPLDVTGDVNTSTGYRAGGAAGLTSSRTVVYSVVPSSFTLQYLNWASAPVSATVVTGVAVSTTTHGFTGGILTT